MATTRTETEPAPEVSQVESQGAFQRVVIARDAFLCLPSALFTNNASDARDHCGTVRSWSFTDNSERKNISKLVKTIYSPFRRRRRFASPNFRVI